MRRKAYKEKDENGRVIYFRHNGLEWWKKYDSDGNEIYFKKFGIEWWRVYDKFGNLIHHRDVNGFEEWYTYNERHFLTGYKNSNGEEKVYNNKGGLITHKSANGFEWELLYDEKGKLKKKIHSLRKKFIGNGTNTIR